MKTIGVKFIIYLTIICMLIPMVQVSAVDSVVNITMSGAENVREGDVFIVKIAVGKPSKALAGIEFSLEYDNKYVTPNFTVNSEENQEMNALVKTMPQNWEQMCTFVATESRYYFRFAMPDKGDIYLNTDQGIILEIPFTVIKSGTANFKIADKNIIAIAADSSFSVLTGTGCEFAVVTSNADEKFAIELGENDTAPQNSIYNLEIQAKNLSDNSGIIGIEFALNYDKTAFQPTITQNDNGQMDVFMKDMPKSAWEQMCTLKAEEGKLILRFAALHAESIEDAEILASGATLTISVPFAVMGAEGSNANFTVDSISAIGVNNQTQKLVGRGDYKSINITKSQSLVPPGLYEVKSNHLLYVATGTQIGDFLSGLSGVYVTDNGEKITDGVVQTGYVLTNGATSLTIVVKGDVNGNGKVDATDYILTKRTYYDTYNPNTAQLLAMTISGKDKPTTTDYILIKRHYFGTFDINKKS